MTKFFYASTVSTIETTHVLSFIETSEDCAPCPRDMHRRITLVRDSEAQADKSGEDSDRSHI